MRRGHRFGLLPKETAVNRIAIVQGDSAWCTSSGEGLNKLMRGPIGRGMGRACASGRASTFG
jgi:hypothetical protein